MFRLLLFMHFMLVFCKTAQCIKVKVEDDSMVRKNINIDETIIDGSHMPSDFTVFSITVIPSDNWSEEIDGVTNLPSLERFYLRGIGQKVLPSFRNLKNIQSIYLERNDLTYIKRDSFSTVPVEWIYLSHNQIAIIEKKSFGQTVRQLYLDCNKLTSVSSGWFSGNSNLEKLDLSGNGITVLQSNTFRPFLKLEYIDVGFNKIRMIGHGAFSQRAEFWRILINDNMLTELPSNMFRAGNITVIGMSIQNNQLTYLEKLLMDRLTVSDQILIYNNPWQCPCYEQIRNWKSWKYYERNPDPRNEPRCVVPKQFAAGCVETVEPELFEIYAAGASPRKTVAQFCSETRTQNDDN